MVFYYPVEGERDAVKPEPLSLLSVYLQAFVYYD